MSFVPKKLSEITIEEKVKKFDELYNMALDYFEFVKTEYNDDVSTDHQHYMYEAVVELLGEGVWDKINSLID